MPDPIRFVSQRAALFAILAYAVAAVERVGEAVLWNGELWQVRSNNITQYFVNYVDHGFARRALLGTLLRPLLGAMEHPETMIFWMMVVSNLLVFATFLWLLRPVLPLGPHGVIGAWAWLFQAANRVRGNGRPFSPPESRPAFP